MKTFKKILIYLGCIIGVLLLLVLLCFAVMYFAPGTSVLGYEYVLYNKDVKTSYNTTTDPSVAGVRAIEILTEMSDIYIYPNEESNDLKIFHHQGYSGYAKSINANLNVFTRVETKSFEESTTNYSTFCINIDEPNGWVAKERAAIYVYLPTNISINTIYAKSDSGNIYYISERENKAEETVSVLNCTNLYLKTGEFGKLSIDNKHSISNYYLKTSNGKVEFKDISSISANIIKFETDTGYLNVTNADGTATLNLSNRLEIKSYDNYTGPYVQINKLIGNLKVDAYKGTYKINGIGSYNTYKQVAMTLNKATIDFDTVYGYVSILGDGEGVANNINIDYLNYTSNTNVFENGSGNVYIDKLNGDASFDATSGKVEVNQATRTSSIYAYSTSGTIDIEYDYYEEDNRDTQLTVITKTGDIDLKNVSCKLIIKVLDDSADASLNVKFAAVSVNDNIIDAKNRDVNIILQGLNDYFQFRIVSTSRINISSETVGQQIKGEYDTDNTKNEDYLLGYEDYKDFNFGYRIGYIKSAENDTYNSKSFDLWGKVLLTTSGSTFVNTVITTNA